MRPSNFETALEPATVSSRHSLRFRLPLLISALIALVLLLFLAVAYYTVERTIVRAGGERAQAAAGQVATLLNALGSVDQLHRAASSDEVRGFLLNRTDEARALARKRLESFATTGPRRIELWDNTGARALEIVVPAPTAAGASRTANVLPPIDRLPPTHGIGPLQGNGRLVYFDAVADVDDEPEEGDRNGTAGPLGYVIVRSTFSVNPPGIIGRLVGQDAIVAVGNKTGGVWTDFSQVVPAPAVDLTRRDVSEYTRSDGERRVGATAPIAATPWTAWVAFPRARLVAPAHRVLTGLIAVALLFVGAGALLASTVASRIITPLAELNAAAEAVAAGDYSRRVNAARRDEVGRLGRTFNAMGAQLASSEASYRLLFESNPHPMWVYDLDTLAFLDVNDVAIAHYGYSRQEFLARTIMDIRLPSEVPLLLENVSNVAPTVDMSGTWKHRKKDGTILDVEISSHEIVFQGRRARAVVAHDVTDRLRAQQALRHSEELFRGMAETMPHIVWTARPDGWFDYYNRRWFEYTGLTLEAAQGEGWHQALHTVDKQNAIDLWNDAVRLGTPYEVSYRLRRAHDGVYRWHMGRAAPLRDDAGQIVMWVGTCTDVDDAKRAEDDLKALNAQLEERVRARTAQLEEANRELESFSYSVSHDLRAPLRHVQGYVELFTAATEGQLTDKTTRYVKTIKDATLAMGQLIDDLLAFSRIARVQIYEGRVPLDDLVRETISGLEMETTGRNIVWTIAPLPTAIGDPSMLKQVYANLIGNAVKYTRGRDPARIEIGCAGQEDGRSILFVRDNGAGFEMQYAHKLFGVFQRLHRAEEFEGTGIGLATVRRVIVRHGGRTWAEGKLNEGATVYFTVRVVEAEPAAQVPTSDQSDRVVT